VKINRKKGFCLSLISSKDGGGVPMAAQIEEMLLQTIK
jgi:hypothetical protein